MAIWTSPDLEVVLGGPLNSSGLTQDVLDGLIRDGVREGTHLEFKRVEGYRKGNEEEFAKDVAAFANHRGGLILIGVAETGEVARTVVGGVSADDSDERRLRQALINHLRPAVSIDFVRIETDRGPCLAVIVPPSVVPPHAVLQDRPGQERRPMLFPERNGSHTRYLDDPEIADRYLRRQAGVRETQRRVEEIAADGRDALDQAGEGIWPYLAVVPQRPAPARLDGHQLLAARRWFAAAAKSSPLIPDTALVDLTVMAAPGRVVLTARMGAPTAGSADEKPRGFLVELYADGSAFAAYDVEPQSVQQRATASHTAAASFIVLVDSLIALTNIATQWAAHQAGAWGTAAASIGLHDPQRDGADSVIRWNRPVELQSYDHSTQKIGRKPGTRHLSRKPARSVLSLDLANTTSATSRLRLAHQSAAALLPWFGVPDPGLITAEGEIRRHEWGSNANELDAEEWARRQGVTINGAPRELTPFELL